MTKNRIKIKKSSHMELPLALLRAANRFFSGGCKDATGAMPGTGQTAMPLPITYFG